MVLVAINHAPVAERSLVEVREILAQATRQISEETPLTLCFVPRKGGYLYYGGVHGHVRLQRVYTAEMIASGPHNVISESCFSKLLTLTSECAYAARTGVQLYAGRSVSDVHTRGLVCSACG